MLAWLLTATTFGAPQGLPAVELAMADAFWEAPASAPAERVTPPSLPGPIEQDGACYDPAGWACATRTWTPLSRERAWATLPESLSAAHLQLPPPEWYEQPLATDLHPVHVQYVREFMLTLDETLAGRRASGIFRNEVALANAHFAVAAWGAEPLPLPRATQEAMIRELAVAIGMSAEVMARDTLHRSEVWGTVHDVARSIVAPDLTFSRTKGKRTQVSMKPRIAGDRVAQAQQLDGSGVDDDPKFRTRLRRPPAPSIATGVGVRVRQLDEEDDVPFADASVYVQGSRWLIDSWRISGLALDQSWVFSAREQIYPGVSLTLNVKSQSQGILPSRVTGGLLWNLPVGQRLQLRTYLRRELPSSEQRYGAWTPGIQVRGLWRWRTPNSPGRWNLGDRVEYAGTPRLGGEDRSGQQVVVPATGQPWPPSKGYRR